jgi:hypothetical protein
VLQILFFDEISVKDGLAQFIAEEYIPRGEKTYGYHLTITVIVIVGLYGSDLALCR